MNQPCLLTDEHISPGVAELAKRKCPGIKIISLHTWHNGSFLGAPDANIIETASTEGLTLVTFDLRTIPSLLKELSETGVRHGGIVLVSSKSFDTDRFAILATGLCGFWKQHRDENWMNQIFFLKP